MSDRIRKHFADADEARRFAAAVARTGLQAATYCGADGSMDVEIIARPGERRPLQPMSDRIFNSMNVEG